ncbi:hypothetical protein Nepgr_031729 [Nepenthes gracilis]|uniref:Secreted protein n=1 Tax=Nepenthes gracilis TaxID=150966 RepID=A0AAD3TJ20_NEPGR|nr:hypothetical protein Nepgr_031729 [Nepenthes gracilis]
MHLCLPCWWWQPMCWEWGGALPHEAAISSRFDVVAFGSSLFGLTREPQHELVILVYVIAGADEALVLVVSSASLG